ncbi:hypothetical protein QJS10_CPA09g01085 [Acorus calamus]|uniref:PGG domain-containing protein n=1 Tax=Acorus calamus TaxID=4465 RepID=A0AAV9E6D9_ACOCL|nr:hypothetical protein QJS10_CPA09g01085 [Acorus calamus]
MGAEILSNWHNLTTSKNTKSDQASPKVHPLKPQGEAKKVTVNPDGLGGKDLEVDEGDNSREHRITIDGESLPKAGNNQEQAPPNEINKMIVAAPAATAAAATEAAVAPTTTTTTTDADKDDADYVFKISSPLITTSSGAILLISNMKNPLPMDVIFMFALVDLFSGFSLLCLVCREKREMVMLSKFLCCSGFVVMFIAVGSVVVQMLPMKMLICLGIVAAVIIMLAAVAWIFPGKGKED